MLLAAGTFTITAHSKFTTNIMKNFIIFVRFKFIVEVERMSNKNECHACEHAKNVQGCSSKHVAEARKLISEGKYQEADKQLRSFEKHLEK